MVSSEPSLTRSTAGGIAWSILGTAGTVALQIIYTAVMSRLLLPEDFGLVAAALIGLRFVVYVSRFGLGSAVTQRAHLTNDDSVMALRLTIVIGSVTASIAFALSPLLASIVGQPSAEPVMRWLALTLLLTSLLGVPEALLRRRLAFRALAGAQVVSFAVGYLGVGISMALAGSGVWSLVGATIAQALTMLVITAALARPPWRGRFSWGSARSLLSFGGAVSLTGFMEFLGGSIDTIAVGRWIGAAGLGQYSRATYLVGLPVELATTAVSRVLLPSLSRVQGDRARFGRAVTRASGLMACVVMVPMTMVATGARVIVPWFLGSGWEPAAKVLPIVAIGYGLTHLTSLPAVAAEAIGAVRAKLVIQSSTLLVAGAAILTVGSIGPSLHRLAVAWAISEGVRHVLYWIFVFPLVGLSRVAVIHRYAAAAVLAATGSAPLAIAVHVIGIETMAGLVPAAVLGVAAMTAAWMSAGSVLREDLRQVRQGVTAR